jgi:hypothetical protein
MDTTGSSGRGYTVRISLVAAIGGLLFGFDTAIINGAIVFLKRQFAWSYFSFCLPIHPGNKGQDTGGNREELDAMIFSSAVRSQTRR